MTVQGSNEVRGERVFEGRINFVADTTVSAKSRVRAPIHDRRGREV